MLDVTARAVPVFEKVFDVEYPLSKLDTLVAHDFDIGAMENWVSGFLGGSNSTHCRAQGLITGRTAAYLLDPARADLQSKKRIASVQTHEVAHQVSRSDSL